MTCGASFTLLSTVVPFVQESWRKDLGEGGRKYKLQQHVPQLEKRCRL